MANPHELCRVRETEDRRIINRWRAHAEKYEQGFKMRTEELRKEINRTEWHEKQIVEWKDVAEHNTEARAELADILGRKDNETVWTAGQVYHAVRKLVERVVKLEAERIRWREFGYRMAAEQAVLWEELDTHADQELGISMTKHAQVYRAAKKLADDYLEDGSVLGTTIDAYREALKKAGQDDNAD